MGAVLARAVAKRVMNAADRNPPFPGELTVGFPGESKAPTAALMVPAAAVAIGVLMGAVPARAAAERMLDAADRKPPFPGELTVGCGDKKARFPDGLEAIFGDEGAVSVCIFLLFIVARALGGGALP